MRRREFLRVAEAGAALVASRCLLGCGDDAMPPGSPAAPLVPPASTLHLPSAEEMLGWIDAIVRQGIRRPGYAADRWVEEWALQRFRDIGLEDARLEPVTVPYWEAHTAELTLADGTKFVGFALPHTAPGVVSASLARFDGGAVEGRIAVREIGFAQYPQALVRGLATSTYDPTNEFDTLVQTVPFHSEQNHVMDSTVAKKAAGFVGLLTGLPWETCDYYVPYDAEPRPIPGIWLSGANGRALLARMAQGPLEARLEVQAERYDVTSHNVVGTLRGRSNEWVIIASHHDGPWASAVEDGSGIAMVLAQATHWAAVPESERPHNLLFLLCAGHMVNAAGTRAFIAAHGDLLAKTVLEVHLEHVARRCEPDGAGGLRATEEPEVRWWFTSQNEALRATVREAIANHALGRSLIFPATAFSPMPPTDGAYFYPAGVPLVHFLTAPMYLFDSRDTIDKVHGPSLVPLSRAVVQIVASTRDVSAAAMRAG
ncbi:M28 family peptidase [Pendulispora brunnea]|uniref:M28 family peptidase n=1 Tax=Pendulispora brunnea TaxID=2905690 RepID=A0ABZ2KEF1_9BACT